MVDRYGNYGKYGSYGSYKEKRGAEAEEELVV